MFPLDGTCSARNLRQEITISIRSLIAPPLEITCTPGDFVHSIKQHLRVVTQGVLHPDRVQLRLASGMVLESYSLTSRELRLADYGIFSDTSILLRMTWSQVSEACGRFYHFGCRGAFAA